MRTEDDELREAEFGTCPHCAAPLEIVAVKFRLLGPAHTLYGCQECALAIGKAKVAKPKRKASRSGAATLSLGVQKLQLRLKRIPVKRS